MAVIWKVYPEAGNLIILEVATQLIGYTMPLREIELLKSGNNISIKSGNIGVVQDFTEYQIGETDPISATDCYNLLNAIVSGQSQQPKRLVMVVAQAGTAAPTMTILFNELSGTFTWSYISPGNYRLTSSDSAFTTNRTKVEMKAVTVEDGDHATFACMQYQNNAQIDLVTLYKPDVSLGPASDIQLLDDLLGSAAFIFEIEVY